MYNSMIDELCRLPGSDIIAMVGSGDEVYPLVRVRHGIGDKRVLLLGVVHGDEPAGAYSIMNFLKTGAHQYPGFEFTAFPCVNPYGLHHKTRGNSQLTYNPRTEKSEGINLNREFKVDTSAQETRLIVPLIEGKYLFAMDFHETWPEASEIGVPGVDEPIGQDPHEFYFWEVCADEQRRVGRKILDGIKARGLSICMWPTIYEDINSGGVIWYPEGCRSACYQNAASSDAFLINNGYTDHAFTIETPRDGWTMDDRVDAHLIALRIALENIG